MMQQSLGWLLIDQHNSSQFLEHYAKPPEFATGERLYFPFTKDDTEIRWTELQRKTEGLEWYLDELTLTGNYKPLKCYLNVQAKWRQLGQRGQLVCGAVGYKIKIPENEPFGGESFVSLDFGW
jgi:hypothetical protein